jgi:hypothetical protein
MEINMKAADPIVCCFLENNPQKRFILPIIAIFSFFCYTYPHADHKTGDKKATTRPKTDYRNPACARVTAKNGKVHAQKTDTKIINTGLFCIG